MSIDGAVQAAWRTYCATVEGCTLPASVPDLIDTAAARFPERPFVTFFEDGTVESYASFAATSRRLAHGLAAIGITAGMRVGVMLPNRMEYPLTWIALARLGAAMVPINPTYTPRELNYVLTDSGAGALVIDATCVPTLDAVTEWPDALAESRVVIVGGGARRGGADWADLSARGADRPLRPTPAPDTSPQDMLLNVQYTSGTTGFPKGCMLSHDYWIVLARSATAVDAQPSARLLSAQPFFYMDPQWHLLKAALQGAFLHVARRPSLTRYADWLAEYGIEWCQFPQLAMAHLPPGLAVPRLKQSFNAGWRPENQRAFAAAFPQAIGRDMFGMTEIGAGTAVPPAAGHLVGSTSCGVAAPWRRTRIVDEEGAVLPLGATGELQVAGRSILKGYWNKPEETAAAFDGEWFRTGDIFRHDEAGWLHIVGRKKDMIRRSGENIAAREVESVIAALQGIADVAVVPVPDARRGEEAKAFVQFHPGQEMPLAAVLAQARSALAPFKVPRYWAVIAGFPRTSSNKIAKHLLPAHDPCDRAVLDTAVH